MGDQTIIFGALRFIVYLSAPFVAAAVVGAVIAGILRVTTQIEDASISFAGKLAAVSVFLYLAAGRYSNEIIEYTQSLWGRIDLYY